MGSWSRSRERRRCLLGTAMAKNDVMRKDPCKTCGGTMEHNDDPCPMCNPASAVKEIDKENER